MHFEVVIKSNVLKTQKDSLTNFLEVIYEVPDRVESTSHEKRVELAEVRFYCWTELIMILNSQTSQVTETACAGGDWDREIW